MANDFASDASRFDSGAVHHGPVWTTPTLRRRGHVPHRVQFPAEAPLAPPARAFARDMRRAADFPRETPCAARVGSVEEKI